MIRWLCLLGLSLCSGPAFAQSIVTPSGGAGCTTACTITPGPLTVTNVGTSTKGLIVNNPTSTSANALEINLNAVTRGTIDQSGNASMNSYVVALGQAYAWNGRNQINGGSSTCTGTFDFNNNSAGSLAFSLTPASTNGAMQLGQCNTATPTARIFQGEGPRVGTDSNTASADLTIRAQSGTGTGAPGVLHLAGPTPGSTGSAVQSYVDGLRVWYGVARLTSYTVSTLPACATVGAGSIAFVTDATAPTYNGTLTGGGAVGVPVACDGTNWHST